MNKHSVSVQDFQIISMIGKGTYAKVYLVKEIKDGKLYALKVMKKKYIIQKNQQHRIMTQKQVLMGVNHPFIVKLKYSFQNQNKLYLVLEYCPGGQLFSLLSTMDKLNQQQAKFYAVQVIEALEYLHQHNIVYKDLKPQNIIIDEKGYIKLTDFGLSQFINENNVYDSSVCGTPQYFAPQILSKRIHRFEVDWWCLGCLVYEMLIGHPPFSNHTKKELFNFILHQEINFYKLPPLAEDFLRKLLEKDLNKRLGHNGVLQIKQHPWFQKVNWLAIKNKQIKAPFYPSLDYDTDTFYFDPKFTISSLDSANNSSPKFYQTLQKFRGFSYQSAQQQEKQQENINQ